ncbi:hypothetical protein WS98_23035 [Burkholderia territorii]|nr:hypothetical protein WS98_23035 [Burkholderia territorii]KWH05322.1 hypothetical protein WT59_26560 [Burkholderia territorii]
MDFISNFDQRKQIGIGIDKIGGVINIHYAVAIPRQYIGMWFVNNKCFRAACAYFPQKLFRRRDFSRPESDRRIVGDLAGYEHDSLAIGRGPCRPAAAKVVFGNAERGDRFPQSAGPNQLAFAEFGFVQNSE